MQNGSSRMGEVFFALCKSVDTPKSLAAWMCFKYNQLALTQLEARPLDYLSAYDFERDYLVVSFLSKWKGLKTGVDTRTVALRSFTTSEELCRATNERIKASRSRPIKGELASVLYRAQRKISKLLGPFSMFGIAEGYGWGPGATSDIPRRRAFVDTKMCKLPLTVTSSARAHARAEIERDLHWSSRILGVAVDDLMGPFCLLDSVFLVQESSVTDTVAKNAKTDRVIGKEPTLNGFLQKSFGQFIRRRLKSVRIDLDDQTPNQEGARCAYSEGLATLDLKAASDTIAKELVFELLPPEWAFALDSCRTRSTLVEGELCYLQKFSSMGNGFTFELESLIFWALSSATLDEIQVDDSALVYGDDIIVPKESVPLLTEVLSFCGFTLNREKSFSEGNFYESCGKHFFKGFDVTPIYQKETIDDEFELVRMGNRLIRFGMRTGSNNVINPDVKGAWSHAYRMATVSRRLQLPLGSSGDDGWIVPADEFCIVPLDANRGLRCRVAVFPQVTLPGDPLALYAHSLRLTHGREPSLLHFSERSTPYGDDVSVAQKHRWLVGGRYVMPAGEFGMRF